MLLQMKMSASTVSVLLLVTCWPLCARADVSDNLQPPPSDAFTGDFSQPPEPLPPFTDARFLPAPGPEQFIPARPAGPPSSGGQVPTRRVFFRLGDNPPFSDTASLNGGISRDPNSRFGSLQVTSFPDQSKSFRRISAPSPSGPFNPNINFVPDSRNDANFPMERPSPPSEQSFAPFPSTRSFATGNPSQPLPDVRQRIVVPTAPNQSFRPTSQPATVLNSSFRPVPQQSLITNPLFRPVSQPLTVPNPSSRPALQSSIVPNPPFRPVSQPPIVQSPSFRNGPLPVSRSLPPVQLASRSNAPLVLPEASLPRRGLCTPENPCNFQRLSNEISPRESPENQVPANYKFSYSVQDPATAADFAHEETLQQEGITGQYRVLLPDGREQVVSYTADATGYRPQISYQ